MIDNLAAVVQYDSSRAILICLGGEILFITSIIKQLYVNKGEKQLSIQAALFHKYYFVLQFQIIF